MFLNLFYTIHEIMAKSLPVGLNSLGSPYIVVNTNDWFVPYIWYKQKVKLFNNCLKEEKKEKGNIKHTDHVRCVDLPDIFSWV